MSEIRILNATEVRQALPMAEAIEGTKEAYSQLSAGKAIVPLRNKIDITDVQGVSLFMPAFLGASRDLAIKIVSVFPKNPEQNKPVIYGTVLVLDAETGQPLCVMEGSSLTAIRTGAASGAATDILARKDVETAAIFGTGVQARTQLEAICTVRSLKEIRVHSLDGEEASRFAEDMAGHGPIPNAIEVVETPADAIKGADIICTATTSHTPVFSGSDVEAGTHINAIGAFTPDMQEVDSVTILRSLVIVDFLEAVLEEAGDLLIPLSDGRIEQSHIQAELGEIINGKKSGRSSDEEITYFKSVGVAVQDAVAGRIALKNALAKDLGTVVAF
jgi:ornithine cyclodeaminase/alanine dehydrogenase-like protein (mu-crystallin family)